MSDLFQTEIRSAAGLSECEKYRYWLRRTWDDSKPVVCFVMLNPSTADAHNDDPTIRRCISFAKRWGYGALTVVNLFAWRATNPEDLHDVPDPIGAVNDAAIDAAAAGRDVIVAWGANTIKAGRAEEVATLLAKSASRVSCLGYTLRGQPRHPLYVKGDEERLVFRREVPPLSLRPDENGSVKP